MEGHLERLRRAEIEAVRDWLTPGVRVLDFGGGSGYQASIMAALGCDVVAIDLADRPRPGHLFYAVQDYDGRHIPAANASFDLVFSSNVLEHVRPLPPILMELGRTLKPAGLAIHIVPSAGWRFWTSVAHFGFALRYLRGSRRAGSGIAGPAPLSNALHQRGLGHVLKRILPLSAHGEYPNAVAELYYFSKRRWLRVFEGNGFEVIRVSGNGLFYSGYELFPGLSLAARRHLARVLGSACHIFVMRAKPRTNNAPARPNTRDTG